MNHIAVLSSTQFGTAFNWAPQGVKLYDAPARAAIIAQGAPYEDGHGPQWVMIAEPMPEHAFDEDEAARRYDAEHLGSLADHEAASLAAIEREHGDDLAIVAPTGAGEWDAYPYNVATVATLLEEHTREELEIIATPQAGQLGPIFTASLYATDRTLHARGELYALSEIWREAGHAFDIDDPEHYSEDVRTYVVADTLDEIANEH